MAHDSIARLSAWLFRLRGTNDKTIHETMRKQRTEQLNNPVAIKAVGCSALYSIVPIMLSPVTLFHDRKNAGFHIFLGLLIF